jgi:hypothetical protein
MSNYYIPYRDQTVVANRRKAKERSSLTYSKFGTVFGRVRRVPNANPPAKIATFASESPN